MVTKVLIDTNIILDMVDNERKCYESSNVLVQKLFESGTDLYINSDTLTNTFYILKNRKKVTYSEALHAIRKVAILCDVIAIDSNMVFDTLDLCENENKPFKDYEDALQYVCAKKIGAELIVTNDKGFVSPDIKVQHTNN